MGAGLKSNIVNSARWFDDWADSAVYRRAALSLVWRLNACNARNVKPTFLT